MPLEPGQKIASYEILAPLGAGGMGEVWRARDTRLGRDVAIKALPEAFARDPERLARFEREAKLLASLNHPNVGAIYGLEVVDGHRYLVLEFLEGESLSAVLSRGPLPVAEAIEVCGLVAGALESAHESGIVHRDLKPGNVMLLRNGTVKVLDFGLAKGDGGHGSELGASASPTMTYGATQAGMVLGTAAYMSPEQARGKVVDKRSDIWSFGCVLYECLTGKQAFEGETVSDLIAHILTSEPDWNALPAATPPRVRDLMRRCLEKDARRRMRDMGDARIELEETVAPRGSSSYGVPASIAAGVDAAAAKPAKKAGVFLQLFAAVAGAVVAVLATKLLSVGSKAPARSPVRFAIVENDTMKFLPESADVALSPDGRTLAFLAVDSAGTPTIWVRPLAALAPRMLHGTENAQLPFFSPDGQSIAFFTETKLKKVSVTTGDIDELGDVKRARGGTWNKKNQILYAPTSEGTLFVVPGGGGEPHQVTQLDTLRGETGQRFPTFLPDGRHFLYTSLPPLEGRYRICVGDLNGGRPDSVAALASGVQYAAPGWLVYPSPFTIFAQRFDAGSHKLRGPATQMRDQVQPTNYSGSAAVALAGSRALAFLQFPLLRSKLVWIDAAGRETGTLPFPAGGYVGDMVFSPDGKKLAFGRAEGADAIEMWIGDLATGGETRFESEPLVNTGPVWSPDGSKLAWMHARIGPQHFMIRAADGSGEKRHLLEDDPSFKQLDDWTKDGKSLIFDRQHPVTRWDLWTVDVADGKAKPLIAGPYNEQNARLSPDGRWIAYTSDETGRGEVYVQPFPALGKRVQVTTNGGIRPGWTPKGELAFAFARSPFVQMVADILPGAELRIGPPREWIHAPPAIQGGGVTPDGRFAVQVPAGRSASQSIVVILDWPSTLPKP